MYIYYPSCNFATMHLQTAKKVRDYFEKTNADCKML